MNPITVLIVEDDVDVRECMKDALELRGCSVAEAADGVDALAVLTTAPLPRIILLDFLMPRMNGVEVSEALARVEAWKNIPIIVLTADARGWRRAATREVAAVLEKPIVVAELFSTMKALLGA